MFSFVHIGFNLFRSTMMPLFQHRLFHSRRPPDTFFAHLFCHPLIAGDSESTFKRFFSTCIVYQRPVLFMNNQISFIYIPLSCLQIESTFVTSCNTLDFMFYSYFEQECPLACLSVAEKICFSGCEVQLGQSQLQYERTKDTPSNFLNSLMIFYDDAN